MTPATFPTRGEGPTSYARSSSAEGIWPELRRVVTQQALIDTRSSLAGLSHLHRHTRAPNAVFMGIGVTSGTTLSRALPIDTLGMLLSAEQVRVAVQASEITLLLADAHALENGHDPVAVASRSAAYERTLRRVLSRLRWSHVHIVRARALHALDAHARIHAQVKRLAPRDEHPYVTQEIADIEYFARSRGGIVKVGWALEGRDSHGARDERCFDERFKRWIGSHVGFVYCKAGRRLDDRRKKAAPYVATEPERRVCLSRDELVSEKLQRAAAHVSVSTRRCVVRQLRDIARAYKRAVRRPMRGSVEDQVQQLLCELLGPREAA